MGEVGANAFTISRKNLIRYKHLADNEKACRTNMDEIFGPTGREASCVGKLTDIERTPIY